MTTITQLQPSSAKERVQRLGAITHVALTVRDLAVSVPWYRAVTGAEPVLDEDTGPFRHVVFALGDTLLGLHAFPDPVRDVGFDPRRPGLDHVAFGCADPDELSAWATRLDDLESTTATSWARTTATGWPSPTRTAWPSSCSARRSRHGRSHVAVI